MKGFEIIKFSFAGLTLQEPMALITNWLIALFCFYVVFRIRWSESYSSQTFRKFYLVLGTSMIFGGLGHVLFDYFGFWGKYPSWILGTLSGFYLGKGVLHYWKDHKSYHFFNYLLIIKSIILLVLTLVTFKFIYLTIDITLTYLLYSGYMALSLWKKDKNEMKYFVYGVIILFPSLFIYLFKVDLHRFLNREDLSHVFMLACIVFFYFGVKKINLNYAKISSK